MYTCIIFRIYHGHVLCFSITQNINYLIDYKIDLQVSQFNNYNLKVDLRNV